MRCNAIEHQGAYANLALRAELDRSGLDARDRRFVTELVYGTTRMRRACDYLVDRFLLRPVRATTSAASCVSARTSSISPACPPTLRSPRPSSSLLARCAASSTRCFAESPTRRSPGPTTQTRLSYPDWIVERMTADLGPEPAMRALETMNEPAVATVRDDDYVQDLASQWVAELAGAQPGELIGGSVRRAGRQGHADRSAGRHGRRHGRPRAARRTRRRERAPPRSVRGHDARR